MNDPNHTDLIRRTRTEAEAWDDGSGDVARLLRELADALEAMQADAARYRWLRENHAVWVLFRFPPKREWCDAVEEVDAAIDAARGKE